MKCKIKMTYAIELFVEGKSEEQIQDWMSNLTPNEVKVLTGGNIDESYTEEIVCNVADDSIVDYVID